LKAEEKNTSVDEYEAVSSDEESEEENVPDECTREARRARKLEALEMLWVMTFSNCDQ
jgi:hypothetical protein